MGCGAMCADSSVSSSTATNISLKTMKNIIPQLSKTSPLVPLEVHR